MSGNQMGTSGAMATVVVRMRQRYKYVVRAPGICFVSLGTVAWIGWMDG
jgi:hypothetical protein